MLSLYMHTTNWFYLAMRQFKTQYKRVPIASRLKYVVDEKTGCHLWTRAKSALGYGVLTVNYKVCLAHRVAYELKNGPIPEGVCVLHSCDTPACMNPDHMFLGSMRENSLDMVQKDRCGTSKLTVAQVKEIREKYSNGGNQRLLGLEYNVCRMTINNICRRKNWTHV